MASPFNVSPGNWTNEVNRSIEGKVTRGENNIQYQVTMGNESDPASGCEKSFSSSYKCGTQPKNIDLTPEANGKYAVYDCSSEEELCFNNRVTLTDDGNVVSSNRDGTVLWQSGVAKGIDRAISYQPFYASNTPLKRNYLERGETLSRGEILGSPNGKCALRVNPDSPSVLQVVYRVSNSIDINEKQIGGEGAIAVYSLEGVGSDKMGKVGYIDMNGTLREYPMSMIKYVDSYKNLGNYMSNGDIISTHHDLSADQCKLKCNKVDRCAGFNYNDSENSCDLLENNMYPNGRRIMNEATTLYVRDKGVQSDKSCPSSIQDIYGVQWDSFPKGDMMTPDAQCSLGAVTNQQMQELSRVRKELDDLAMAIQNNSNELSHSGETLETNSVESRKKLVKDLAEYQTLLENWEKQNKSGVSLSGSLLTSIQQTSVEQSRVAFWGISGAVSIALLLLILRNHN